MIKSEIKNEITYKPVEITRAIGRTSASVHLAPVAAAMLLIGSFGVGSSAIADSKHGADNSGLASDQIVATVNGKPISKLSLERVTEQLAAQGQQPNRRQIIDELINLEILTQEAEKLELDKSDDVATALHLQYTQTMANAYLGTFSKDLSISEEEIRAEYEKQIAALKVSEYRASHILLESEEDANKVIDELNKGGDFAALAKQYSTGPTGESGGDLGWFQPENMVPEFSDAVAALEKGNTTKAPVQTEFGWHVIQLADTREAAKPDYSAAVKSGIQSTLLRDALSKRVDDLRNSATIEMQ